VACQFRPGGSSGEAQRPFTGGKRGPTIGASVNTTLTSYDGNCDIGVNIDTAAVPDPDVLMTCLRESLAEITALGG
jgi:hypothetical protein